MTGLAWGTIPQAAKEKPPNEQLNHNLAMRVFGGATVGGPFLALGEQAPLRARIKIDTERVIGDIDPKIYGNFIEHLGRCIDGGDLRREVATVGSDGFRKDVIRRRQKLNVTQLRWPGGNFSSNYHWMDGIGPRDKRPPRPRDGLGHRGENRFGTLNEFLEYAEKLGTEPYIRVNLGTGTWVEAQQWVEYVKVRRTPR